MATSRSGTTVHKRMRRTVIAEAQAQGITHCPACGVELDYNTPHRVPNKTEADEIVPYAVRGHTSTDPADWQVLCQQCNQRKGADNWAPTDNQPPYPLSRDW